MQRLYQVLITAVIALALTIGAVERSAEAATTLTAKKAKRAYKHELEDRYGSGYGAMPWRTQVTCRRLTGARYGCKATWVVDHARSIENGLYESRGQVRKYASEAIDVTMSRPECVSACYWDD